MTATTADPMTPALIVEHHDPATLLVDLNIRALKPDKGLTDSIRDLGVLQPIIGYRTEAGAVRVRHGHRRTLAAIEAGRPSVPVIVVAAEAAGTTADIDRVLGQYAENTHRDGLNAADQAGVVTQLLDLGLTAAQVAKRTRIPKPAIAAARAVHGSAVAAEAAVTHGLTLDQAAGVAEFDDDPDAVQALLEAALDGDVHVRHELQRLRDDRAYEQARAATAAELEAAGVTVIDTSPGWEKSLDLLASADGSSLDAETHKDCPGHVAVMTRYWADGGAVWGARWFCADPKANGHKKLRAASGKGASGNDVETEQAERRKVIEGNKSWRNAEIVRRQWLTEFLARKTAPDGAQRFIIESIAMADGPVRRGMDGNHGMAREFLGLPAPASKWTSDVAPVVDLVARASDARALVIALGLVLGAYEGETSVQTWRTPATSYGTARYFAALSGWGYALSAIEQTITGAGQK